MSTSFVFLMSTIHFSFWGLDHFIQLLNPTSVMIGLELLFSSLCLTISENLLSFSCRQEESSFADFLSCGSEFLEHLEFVSQTVSQRVTPFHNDRRTMIDWTTNLRQ